MIVRPSSCAEILASPEFPALAAGYIAEAANKELPTPAIKFEQYRALEAGGLLHIIAAFEANLIGLITVLAAPIAHYGMSIAVSESFFVDPTHRGWAGVKLLRAAEAKAREIGSPAFFVTAPFDSRLAKLLSKMGYAPKNIVFFKAFHDA